MVDVNKLKVAEIMDKKIVAVAPQATIRSAAKLVSNAHVDMLPIVSDGKLTGMVMSNDLLAYSMEHDEEEMADLMIDQLAKPPIFVEKGSSIKEAITISTKKGLSRLPVVENRKSMRMVGFVSSTELLKEIAKASSL